MTAAASSASAAPRRTNIWGVVTNVRVETKDGRAVTHFNITANGREAFKFTLTDAASVEKLRKAMSGTTTKAPCVYLVGEHQEDRSIRILGACHIKRSASRVLEEAYAKLPSFDWRPSPIPALARDNCPA